MNFIVLIYIEAISDLLMVFSCGPTCKALWKVCFDMAFMH